jgi:hypothetical protein
MEYPNLKRLPENNEKDAGPASKHPDCNQEGKSSEFDEKARLLQVYKTDELLARYRINETFFQGGLTQVLQICTTISETQDGENGEYTGQVARSKEILKLT